jgi:hypothetical protein
MKYAKHLALILFSLSCAVPLCAQPIQVSIEKVGVGFKLTRAGQPYFIRGAGGDASKRMLRELGGNSFRTWGAEAIMNQLDEAGKLGLTVTIGIWLAHKALDFSYDDRAQVDRQFEAARMAIDEYKDHPALLMWGIGNEMEMGQERNPAVWKAVERIAAYARKIDPKHPTMTVVAEIDQNKLAMINRYCPSIDVIGINAYGGAPSLAQRYKKLGGTKPYVLTEFGPPGPWEVKKTSWGAPIEVSSTDKSAYYRRTYEKSIANQPMSLGSYAFVWGNKQEATATWFGLLLADGTRLGAVDVLSNLWTGKPMANTAPTLVSLRLLGPDKVQPESDVHLKLNVRSANSDDLKVDWVLQLDPQPKSSGGANEAVPPVFAQSILRADSRGVAIKMPKGSGGYRVFAYVRDGRGAGAVANVALFVEGGAPAK